VRKVGLFVNSPAAEVVQIFDQVGLDVIQLHGDEPPEMLALFQTRPVIRAFRCRDSGFAPLIEYVNACRLGGYSLEAVLIDAYQPGRYGGTGRLADWSRVPELTKELIDMPVILAGGLRPDNVAEAIRIARPAAVDTASGVESSPGRKDEELVRGFVNNASAAFARLD
jgi:phosphoribosylanthranilate isomerase